MTWLAGRGVSAQTVTGFELLGANSKILTLNKIRRALETAGVRFIDEDEEDGPGVRLQKGKPAGMAATKMCPENGPQASYCLPSDALRYGLVRPSAIVCSGIDWSIGFVAAPLLAAAIRNSKSKRTVTKNTSDRQWITVNWWESGG